MSHGELVGVSPMSRSGRVAVSGAGGAVAGFSDNTPPAKCNELLT